MMEEINLVKLLKKIRRELHCRKSIRKAYMFDCREYTLWQYNNPRVQTQNALEAKILRQAHIIEKGMSLSEPREGFGVQKANMLIELIEEFIERDYKIEESIPAVNAISVLAAYIDFHKKRGYFPDDVVYKFNSVKSYLPSEHAPCGIITVSKSELEKEVHGEFPEFFCSRHSVRQFSDKTIDLEDIKKALKLAMRAPSACNRQTCKAYIYQDKRVNVELGKLISGNTGFDNEVQKYIVVTSDMSAFYDDFERNQVYVDGGIFTMALIEALHYYGIASCVLQNGEFKQKNTQIKKICGNIPENEKIILFIAIGYYKEEFSYAVSQRKNVEDVLIVQ